MKYKSIEVTIENTNKSDIADRLMRLADFPVGSCLAEVSNIYRVGNSRDVAASFHKEIMDEVLGDLTEAIAYHGPNIIVGQFYSDDKPTGKYIIEFDTEKVDESLIHKLK